MKIDGIIRGWYEKNKRDLPWRQTRDPYKIWMSEVILQQTRVNQGLNYYLRFINNFPDVTALARADEDEVLKIWQGLGYYSRARNLHQAAKTIVDQMNGEMPHSYAELLKLKGIGHYTASAIASICFEEPCPVVDGNVSRVIARLYGMDEPVNSSRGVKLINSLAQNLLDRNDPGTHNQAMMEFGALQCVPVSPDCQRCPLKHQCEAWATSRVDLLPVKIPKRKPVERWMYFYILLCDGETIIEKRGADGIWKSLYQFPMIESEVPLTDEESVGPMLTQVLTGNKVTNTRSVRLEQLSILNVSNSIRHQLTHRTIHARFIHVNLPFWPHQLPSGWIKIKLDRLDDFAVPRLINRYMEVAKI